MVTDLAGALDGRGREDGQTVLPQSAVGGDLLCTLPVDLWGGEWGRGEGGRGEGAGEGRGGEGRGGEEGGEGRREGRGGEGGQRTNVGSVVTTGI